MSSLTVAEALEPSVLERIKEKSEIQSDGCWLWKGRVKEVKDWLYPQMSVNNQVRFVRALAWIIQHQTLPPRGGVSPKCGVALCVNPEHQVSKFETYIPGIFQ